MSMSKQRGKRTQCSSSSSEERGDGSQPQVKRRHQALFGCQSSCSCVLDAIDKKFREEIPPLMEDAIGKVIPIMIETQSHMLSKLESIVKVNAEQMAEMRAQNSALKCQNDQQLAKIQELENLVGQQNKAAENPAVVTENQIEELPHMNPQDAMPVERAPSRPSERCYSRSLQLRFKTQLSGPLYTGKLIGGVEGASIYVDLIDANTGNVVESDPEASIKLDVVVLEGDFNVDNKNGWTRKYFEDHQMRQREGKAPLLVGNLQVMLERGVGELGKLKFTDNSSWHRSKMFRIGLKVAPGYCEGIRILEAITEAFRVKEHRGELYKKQERAKPGDEVWRLKNIGKNGAFHKRLEDKGVFFVEDFLREYVRDSESLRNVRKRIVANDVLKCGMTKTGCGMPDTKWNVLVEHAKSCVQSEYLYQYYYDEARNHSVVFDIIGQLQGYTAGGCFYSTNPHSDKLKEPLDEMVRKAYNNWAHVEKVTRSSYSVQNQVPGYNDTEVTRNIQNCNLNVATQNLLELPLHQNSAPTERHLAPPTFHGHSTTNAYLHGDQGSMENLCLTFPQDDHGTIYRMSDSDGESLTWSLNFCPSQNLPQLLADNQCIFSNRASLLGGR